MKRVVLAALVVTFVTPALAQVRPVVAPVAPVAPVVVHNMDEDLIEGVVLKAPHLPLVGTPPKPTHKNLIQVRKNFTAELLASASNI